MRTALIIVDVQRDFLPGGALAVTNGDFVIPAITELARTQQPDPIVASADWHPPETRHFDKWPVHCVANTPGSQIARPVADLVVSSGGTFVVKGRSTEDDGYSAFEGLTASNRTLDALLQQHGITDVIVTGLALDFCVKATALSAAHLGYTTHVPFRCTKPVFSEGAPEAVADLRFAGVEVT